MTAEDAIFWFVFYWPLSMAVCLLVPSKALQYSSSARDFAVSNPVKWRRIKIAMAVLAPVILPLVWVYGLFKIFPRFLSRLNRLEASLAFRPVNFEPVNVGELELWYQAGFEKWGAEFEALAFYHHGDFRLKDEPRPLYSRCYGSSDGTILGSVTAIEEQCVPDLISVLEDGTVLTSARMDHKATIKTTDDDKLVVFACPDGTLVKLLQRHEELIKRETRRRGQRLLAFMPEQFQDVVRYENVRFATCQKKKGELYGHVPEPQIPEGTPVANREMVAV